MSDCGCNDGCSESSITKTTGELTAADRMGMIRCRLSNKTRSNYRVPPGLYALGSPGNLSPVFVSANYRYSFDVLRSALKGTDCYILVLDTKGINVWCAAGKGTFGTEELVGRIEATGLAGLVQLKRVIVPQLGAVGVAAHEVKERTGFTVRFGPVDARDLPSFIANRMKTTPPMRAVKFTAWDRLVLTPMEFVPAAKRLLPLLALVFVLAGLSSTGILFAPAMEFVAVAGTAVLAGFFCGTIAGPLLLPIIPFRSFALKGLVVGMVYPAVVAIWFRDGFAANPFLFVASLLAAPGLSSYLLLQFTGSTTITGITGVKKELRYALPAYRVAMWLCAILAGLAYLRHWLVI